MANDEDVILLTSLIHDQTLKNKILEIKKKITVITIDRLQYII